MARQENLHIRAFILAHVEAHPHNITSVVTHKFGISRTAANAYMQRLIAAGLLEAVEEFFEISLFKGLSEDSVWRFRLLPHLKEVPQNILQYVSMDSRKY